MPLILQAQESLPYIDPTPTTAAFAAAKALVESECEPSLEGTLHSSIASIYEPKFSPLLLEAHSRLLANKPLREAGEGVDLTRYETPEGPGSEQSSSNDSWRGALCKAYTSHAYLEQRRLSLSLLERFGKNAWLIANAQVEDELLRPAEKELEQRKREVEEVERNRRDGQESIKGELMGLEETWRSTVGRSIEAEVATQALRRKVLDRRRAGEHR